MINLNEQLDKVIAEQLGKINPMLEAIGEGEQKEFIKNAMNRIKQDRTLDPAEFVEQFAKIKGEAVDIEKLREMAKNGNHGS